MGKILSKPQLTSPDIDKKTKYISYLISFQLLGSSIGAILRYLSFRFFNNSNIGTYIYVISMSLALGMYLIKYPINRTSKKCLRNTICFLLLIAVSYCFFSTSQSYIIDNSQTLLEAAIIGMFCSALISEYTSWDYLFGIIRKMLFILTPALLIVYILAGFAYFGAMSWGIRITPLCLIYYYVVRSYKTSIIEKIFFAISVVLSLFGGRQSLIIVFGTILLCELYFLFVEPITYKKTIKILFMIVFFVVFIIEFNAVIQFISNIIEKMGFHSRSITMLLNEQLFDDSNRGGIYKICWEYIEKSGASISGLYTDRYYLATQGFDGYFAHNFVLELLMDFGTVVGTFLVLSIIISTLIGIVQAKQELKPFTIVMIAIGIGRYFVSGTIISSSAFWVCLGYLSNRNIRKGII